MTGSKRLASFLRTHRITQREAADALGVSPSMLHYWLKGSRPGEGHRLAIERYTKGGVPADAWLTATERARADRVRPFDATGTDDGE